MRAVIDSDRCFVKIKTLMTKNAASWGNPPFKQAITKGTVTPLVFCVVARSLLCRFFPLEAMNKRWKYLCKTWWTQYCMV